VACAIDGIRPGTEEAFLPGEGGKARKISASVAARTRYGSRMKQQFYSEEAGRELDEGAESLEEMRFTSDFQQLAQDSARGRLDGKMAVLYFDGNGFGALQDEVCKTRKDVQAFDQLLRDRKRILLKSLLAEMRENDGWIRQDSGGAHYRLETLLW